MNGAGGTGAGWKYGYHILLENYATISHFSTHRFCLSQSDIMVLSTVQVVLVLDMMLASCSDKPNRSLGFGIDTSSTVERDLRASSGVKVVVSEPSPKTFNICA